MFFDDRLAMPDICGGSVAEAVRHGARPVKLDLSVVLGVLAQATSTIGPGAPYYPAPFHLARTFATMDHLSGGRAAWNAVTRSTTARPTRSSTTGMAASTPTRPRPTSSNHHGEYFSTSAGR